ncbi:unnamed protein product [Penicillium salamii]|nr:unnamed protein product [Penicillium salamii]CAG8417736.1 unnamed protein product [Penicillium salamii]
MAPAPIHPTQTDEHKYWTDPILCEETRARLQHFRKTRFYIQSNEDYVDYLLLEDQTIYMNFFEWISKTSREKLLQSYNEYWRRLCQYFELFARRHVDKDVRKQMRRFLAGIFPTERRIPRRTKNKNTLDVDAFVQLWSAITDTRPSVLLPQDTSLPNSPVLSKRQRNITFQSNLPKHISLKDLLDSVYYRDIELFYLKDPQSKRNILCAIIEFRNLKGRPKGADGDYQLTYCPIAQIIAFAFRDRAFTKTDLTPKLI